MENLRELRLKRGITQKEIADKLGIDRVSVTKWESGVSAPRTKLLPKLAGILKCRIDDLFCKNV